MTYVNDEGYLTKDNKKKTMYINRKNAQIYLGMVHIPKHWIGRRIRIKAYLIK